MHQKGGETIKIDITVYTLILLTLTLTINSSFAQPSQLEVTVSTDRVSYIYRQMVEINGNLTMDNASVEGLVGIEVDDPSNYPIMVRTASVGIENNFTMEILAATPCNEIGIPKTTFSKNNHAHLNVTLKNNDLSPLEVLITVCAYDSDSTPISPWVNNLQTTVLAGATIQFTPDIYIESWVSTGPAIFYVNAYSDWPRKGGYPYCPQKSAAFNVVSGGGERPTIEETEGAFSLNFRLPPAAPFGTYTIYARAFSQDEVSSAMTTFSRPFQIVGDVNFDHVINILDLVMITARYGTESGDPSWNPELDIQPNGAIDIQDVIVVSSKYGTKYGTTNGFADTQENAFDSKTYPTKITDTAFLQETDVRTCDVETGIDLYSQYPDGFNGKGLNMPSDMYWPRTDVRIYACARYNHWPEQEKDVAFELTDPHGTTRGIFHNRTDESGITFIKFQLPSEDLEYYFGKWTVTATVNIAGVVYTDTLTFKYDYHARTWCDRVFTDKPSYKRQEMINLTIAYGTQSMQIFPAVFIIAAIDEMGVPFAYEWVKNVVGDAQYCTYSNGTLILNIYIPKSAFVGTATLHIDLFHGLMQSESICPTCTLTIQIEPD